MEEFQLATMLDPRFKLHWCSDEQQKTSLKDLLVAKVSEISPAQSSAQSSDTATSPPRKKPRNMLFGLIMADQPSPTLATSSEVETYLSGPIIEDGDSLFFWKEHQATYPTLATLAIHSSPNPNVVELSREKFQCISLRL